MTETRRKKCQCNTWLEIIVELPLTEQDQWLRGLNLSLVNQESTVNFFGRNTKKKDRAAVYPFEFCFVFCLKCDRRHQIRTFKP